MELMIKPIGDKVLVREDDRPEMVDGIYLPAKPDDDVWEPESGEVVGLGEGKTHRMDGGAVMLTPPDVNLGDRVRYDPWRGTHFDHDGVGYRLLDRDEVLAVEVA